MSGPSLLVGCSGWDYPEWVGGFYPPKGRSVDRLGFYSRAFPLVEINTSFYQIPTLRAVESWARRTPRGFRFTAKLPQEVTHVRRLRDVDEPLAAFYRAVRPLVRAGKLEAVLVQLPPSLPFEPAAVREFYGRLPKEVPVAVEFRERSWCVPASYELLREFGLSTTVVDEPFLPVDLTLTTSLAYVRLHGRGDPLWYDYRYGAAELAAWKERLLALGSVAERTVVLFNNHFHANAPQNALELQGLMGLLPPPWSQRLDHPGIEPRAPP